MRFLMIAVASTFLLMPAVQANACGAKHSVQAASTELSAKTKKATKKVAKAKKEKVEYMRAAPMK
jgi:hypothetical protein